MYIRCITGWGIIIIIGNDKNYDIDFKLGNFRQSVQQLIVFLGTMYMKREN